MAQHQLHLSGRSKTFHTACGEGIESSWAILRGMPGVKERFPLLLPRCVLTLQGPCYYLEVLASQWPRVGRLGYFVSAASGRWLAVHGRQCEA